MAKPYPKKKIIITILVLTLIILGGYLFSKQFFSSATKKAPWYSEFSLNNGMRVIVIPNHKIPAVTHMVWYKVGSIDEVRGKSGLAHFLEHLMFKGTRKFPDGKFSYLVELNGGNQNAMTSYDYTAYFQTVSKDNLSMVMDMEADRMKNLELTAAQVASEDKVIIEERRMKYDNVPRMLLQEQISASLFQNHPYGTQVIGWEHEMAGLTREDALSFYKKYYAPNNATLIVGGDITAEELKPLAEKYYGEIPKEEVHARAKIDEPPQRAERRLVYEDGRVKQPEFWRSYYAPSAVYGETKDAMPLIVLSKIMGEGTLSRLYKSLVVEKKIAIHSGTNYSLFSIGPADFQIYALPANGVTTAQLEAAVDEEIQNIIAKGISEDELARAKKSMIAELTYSHEGISGMAFFTGQVISVGLSPDYITDLEDKLNAVTAAEIQAAANKVFQKKNSVTGYLKGKH